MISELGGAAETRRQSNEKAEQCRSWKVRCLSQEEKVVQSRSWKVRSVRQQVQIPTWRPTHRVGCPDLGPSARPPQSGSHAWTPFQCICSWLNHHPTSFAACE